MSNEIKVTFITGANLYFVVQSPAGLWWYPTGIVFETYNAAHWTNYAIPMTEVGVTGDYFGDFPTAITTPATYRWEARTQAGGTPATSDTPLVADDLVWNPAAIPTPPVLSGVYLSPTTTNIRLWTGVNEDMDEITAGELDADLTSFLPLAETRTALTVTEAVFDSATLTARQVVALQMAVAYRVAAEYLLSLATKEVSGTQAPILAENAQAFRDQAAAFETQAVLYDGLLVGVDTTDTTVEPLGALETGEILLTSPNDYLDSYRPEWVALDEIVVQ